MERGEAAHKMLMAAAAGRDFRDAGVPRTARNVRLYVKMAAEIRAIPDGQVTEVPFDHALMPDVPPA
jgi:hypothetical protein